MNKTRIREDLRSCRNYLMGRYEFFFVEAKEIEERIDSRNSNDKRKRERRGAWIG